MMIQKELRAAYDIIEAMIDGIRVERRARISTGTWMEITPDHLPDFNCFEYRRAPSPREWWMVTEEYCCPSVFTSLERAKRVADARNLAIVHVREVL